MTRRALNELFKVDIDADCESIAFVGDSPNDGPMFAFFPFSVGVANVRNFEKELTDKPAYVTEQPGGSGFAEFAQFLIENNIS